MQNFRKGEAPEGGAKGRPRAGDQLELDLRMPWSGYSPRVLTSAYRAFSFGAEGMGRLDGSVYSCAAPEVNELVRLDQFSLFIGGYRG